MRVPYLSDMMDNIDLQLYADPRTKDWFLCAGSPVLVWTLSITYLLIVIVIGPMFMKKRSAYSLKKLMILYNVAIVLLSFYMFIEFLLSTSNAEYPWLCSNLNKDTWKRPSEYRVASVIWVFTVSKIVELMDTVLMILRKKYEQVTFLHVFHHVLTVNVVFVILRFSPGGNAWLACCLNSLVHTVMYSYYGLSLFPSLRRFLWWKRYITRMQLVQFVLVVVHLLYNHFTGCDFPLWCTALLTGHMVIMIILFTNFYYQTYITAKKGAKTVKIKEN